MDSDSAIPESYVRMIEQHVGVLSDPIRGALSKVHRHRFLDGWYSLVMEGGQPTYQKVAFDRDAPSSEQLAYIYSNKALITAYEGIYPTSSTSQPSLVAEMLDLLDVRPQMRILEIGTGTGYNAALLAELCGDPDQVFTVEVQPEVADRARRHLKDQGYGRVHVVCSDGSDGIPDGAPYDRIIATVGCSDLSPDWLTQLKPDGVLLVPLQHGVFDPILRLHHARDHTGTAVGRVVAGAGFMPIQGCLAWEAPWRGFRFGAAPGAPKWRRSIPEDLAVSQEVEHPLRTPTHKSFHFFLALEPRQIYYDSSGYGIADSANQSIVRITGQALEGVTLHDHSSTLETLYDQVLALHESWASLGHPDPTAYSIAIGPPVRSAMSSNATSRFEWQIERPRHIETLRLTSSLDGSSSRPANPEGRD